MTKMTHTCPECGDVSIAWAVHECWVVRKEQTQERLEPLLVTKVADADDNPNGRIVELRTYHQPRGGHRPWL